MQHQEQAKNHMTTNVALPLWDKQKALVRLGQNQALLEKVVAIFLAQAAGNIEKLTAAVREGDTDAIRHYSHYLKGGAGDIGLSRLHHFCGAIEAQAKADELPAIEAMLDDFLYTATDTLACLQSQQSQQ